MHKTLKRSFILCFIVLSCNSTKNKVNNKKKDSITNSSITNKNNKYLEAGYKLGLIAFNEEGKCVYTITDKNTKVIYDPINFMEIAIDELKYDAVKVYFKFRPLRMKNRCENLQPIELTEIKKRED